MSRSRFLTTLSPRRANSHASVTRRRIFGSALCAVVVTAISLAGDGTAVAAASAPSSTPAAAVSPGTFGAVSAAATSWQSTWAGFVYPRASTSVSATLIMPSPTCGTTTASAVAGWVGLDGYNNGTVEQTGISLACAAGHVSYSAWYEVYPAPAQGFPIVIKGGDHVVLTVQSESSHHYLISFSDVTNGQHASTTQSDAGLNASAECITESSQSKALMAFGKMTFDGCIANGKTAIPANGGQLNLEANHVILTHNYAQSTTSFYTN